MTSYNTVPCTVPPSNLGVDGSRMNNLSTLRLQEERICRELCQTTIGMLPDNVLLEIFDFYREDSASHIIAGLSPWRWEKLTHVCRRWRHIVFGSPRRLELQVLCTSKTSTRTSLSIWPAFPIFLFVVSLFWGRLENVIAAVECRDRISHIYIDGIDGPALEHLVTMIQEPFPLLTTFHLLSFGRSAPVLPEAFLGGSAPLLQLFILYGIPFPTFPKFILSATRIVILQLFDIPDSGYISPEEMATCLAALPNLRILILGFRSPLSRPLQMGLPSLIRVVLPALTRLSFRGTIEYFEDFLTRTHIPLLDHLCLRFFMDLIFDIPRLHSLIAQAEGLGPLNPAWVMFGRKTISIRLGLLPQIELAILCEERDWQLLSLAQVCNRHLPLSSVEHLSVCELTRGTSLDWKDDMDSSQWLELFRPFIAVQNLYVSKQFVPFVTGALQELTGERTMEVLPVLKNLFLEGLESYGPVQEAIKPFVSARQLSDHSILIHSEPPHPPPPLPRLLQVSWASRIRPLPLPPIPSSGS